jgi:hypothetical protein
MMIDGLNVFIAGLEAKWCAFTQQEHRAAPRARAPIRARARDFLLNNLQLCTAASCGVHPGQRLCLRCENNVKWYILHEELPIYNYSTSTVPIMYENTVYSCTSR